MKTLIQNAFHTVLNLLLYTTTSSWKKQHVTLPFRHGFHDLHSISRRLHSFSNQVFTRGRLLELSDGRTGFICFSKKFTSPPSHEGDSSNRVIVALAFLDSLKSSSLHHPFSPLALSSSHSLHLPYPIIQNHKTTYKKATPQIV